MALKSSNKPRKTTSSKKGATQPTSTVTPIGIAISSGENHSHALPRDLEIEEQVRIRAYELFEERGRQEGYDRDDWARAEAEILAKFQRKKSA